jgi:alpha-glucosidase
MVPNITYHIMFICTFVYTKYILVEVHTDNNWLWWKHGVIYHIYPRSFSDSNGDGIGDIRGIISKLDYLSNLGIDGIWLSPVYPSPMVDFGYDIANYQQIDPVFGTLTDFRELLDAAHSKRIRVIMDLVMNHTSEKHPWFTESRSSRDNPKRDWYIWKKGKRGNTPNNWKTVFGGSVWEYDHKTQEYYLHTFFKEQADLNWHNEDLKRTFFNGIKFWLDMGVDGFRVDVINLISKDTHFRDNPIPFGIPLLQKLRYNSNMPESYNIARELRSLLDDYSERMCVAEVYSVPPGDSAVAASYLDKGHNAMNMAFDFSLMLRGWSARKYFHSIRKWYSLIPESGWACNVLSNHDLHRNFDRFWYRRNKIEKARVSAMLLLTLKGTPFLYYGDEIGMRNARLKRKEILDPLGKLFWPFFKGRDKGRSPMQWTHEEHGGFSDCKPWLPVNDDYPELNVRSQERDKGSLFNFYRTLIALRKRYKALSKGEWSPLIRGKNGILVYLREFELEKLMVILNFSSRRKKVELPGNSTGKIVFSTHRVQEDEFFSEMMIAEPFEATLIEFPEAA